MTAANPTSDDVSQVKVTSLTSTVALYLILYREGDSDFFTSQSSRGPYWVCRGGDSLYDSHKQTTDARPWHEQRAGEWNWLKTVGWKYLFLNSTLFYVCQIGDECDKHWGQIRGKIGNLQV